ncbi:hypothetical protein BaRGS_00013652 [Batillaria attramentaria]|uniref:Chloride channel CLIC-like protein 1 n=1 Tax=Batillaria attramentaria TaxID=370345 RepID=A0ABD0L764_9CAEN
MKCFVQVAVLYLIIGDSFTPYTVNGDDHDDIDPFDMENFDQISMKMKKKTDTEMESTSEGTKLHALGQEAKFSDSGGEEQVSSPREMDTTVPPSYKSDDVVRLSPKDKGHSCPAQFRFQHFVSRLLLFVKSEVQQTDEHTATDICLRLSLSPSDLEVLESFKRDSSGHGILDRTHDVLTEAVHGAHAIGADDPSVHILWLEEKFGLSIEKAVQVAMLLVLFVVLLLLLMKLTLGRRLFKQLLFIGFFFSVLTTWYRLYKGEVAKQHEAMMKDLPSGCATLPEGQFSIAGFFNYYFSFQKDACIEYYEHMVVDPIVKVSIMEALAVAVVQTLLKPMRTVGTELSEFMRALVRDLPVQWQFFTVTIVFAFVFLAMFLSCGYRVRIPFLLAIEPTHRDKTKEVMELRQQVLTMQSKIESIGATATVQSAILEPGCDTGRRATLPEQPARLTQGSQDSQVNLRYHGSSVQYVRSSNHDVHLPSDSAISYMDKEMASLLKGSVNDGSPLRTSKATACGHAAEVNVERIGDGVINGPDSGVENALTLTKKKINGVGKGDEVGEDENKKQSLIGACAAEVIGGRTGDGVSNQQDSGAENAPPFSKDKISGVGKGDDVGEDEKSKV